MCARFGQRPVRRGALAATIFVLALCATFAPGCGGKSGSKPPAPTTPATPALAIDTLSASTTSGYAPLYVALRAVASGGHAPYRFRWRFGDGASDTARAVAHIYESASTFTCTLVAIDADSDTVAKSLPIVSNSTPSPLAAVINATPTAGTVPFDVTFQCTPQNGQSPYTYAWSFGDGGTSTDQNPTHTFGHSGQFDARVSIQDAASSVCTRDVPILARYPTFRCSPTATPAAGPAPLAVTFAPHLSVPVAFCTFAWTFGDGSTSTAVAPSHTYTRQGLYTATLRVSDATGHSATGRVGIGVGGSVVSCNTTANPLSGIAPLAVTFTGSATGGTAPYSFAWAFGDGDTAVALHNSVAHVYANPGTYHAVMGVVDSKIPTHNMCADPVVITVHRPLAASLIASPTMGVAPLALSVDANVEGGISPYTYLVTYGDGQTGTTLGGTTTYGAWGNYHLVLKVTDAAATSVSDTVGVSVAPAMGASNVQCAATASTLAGQAPLTVGFGSTASGGTPPYRTTWTFGDGTGSSAASPAHTYTSAGTYVAVCTVADANGSCTKQLTIDAQSSSGMTCAGDVSVAEGYAPLFVRFGGTSTGGAGTPAYHWDFGDGTGVDSAATAHVYATGTWDAVLTVKDALLRTCTQHVPITAHAHAATTLRIVNDLQNWSDPYLNRENQVVSLRVGSDPTAVALWSAATEQLDLSEFRATPGAVLPPQYRAQTAANTKDIAVTSLGPSYAVEILTGWWDWPPDGFESLTRHYTEVSGCDCSGAVLKGRVVQVDGHYAGTLTLRLSDLLPDVGFCRFGGCLPTTLPPNGPARVRVVNAKLVRGSVTWHRPLRTRAR